MNSTEFFQHGKRTESPTISTVNNRILHGAIGIGTEAGEVLDAIKKSMFYGRSLNFDNIKEELGDLLWYMGLIADEVGTTFEQLMDENIIKLRTRYPEQFTPEDEQRRNYGKEAEAVKATAVHPSPPAPRPIGSPACFGQTCDDCGSDGSECNKCRESCDHCMFQEMCAIAINKLLSEGLPQITHSLGLCQLCESCEATIVWNNDKCVCSECDREASEQERN